MSQRYGHPYFMYDAIHQQPSAVEDMLNRHGKQAKEVASLLAEKRRLYLVGIGTSWHAALTAEHWFRCFAGDQLVVQAWHSFDFVAYQPPLGPNDAVIVITHRGTKTYSFKALDVAKAFEALTIVITGIEPGPRVGVADVTFHTVEQERSAALTVSYTAALAVLALLALELGSIQDLPTTAAGIEELRSVPSLMESVLSRQEEVEKLAWRYVDRDRYLCTGWGPNTALAYEVALKIKEACYCTTEGFQVEQILHGSFVATTDRSFLTLIAPPGPGYERSLELARASAVIGATVWALVQNGDGRLSDLVPEVFSLPPIPELWSPFVYILPLQLFTYYLALANKRQPDTVRRDEQIYAEAKSHYSL